MISRGHMRRQLRASGGITNARQGYGIGSWVKERIRKIIPNELASVASKAAPFVAMLPGYGPLAAGIMRGVGRFDKRGSISDALKQGLGTYAGGKVFDAGMRGAGLRETGGSAIKSLKELPGKFMEKGSEFLNKGINTLGKSGTAGEILKGQLLVGGGTAIASFIASQFAEDPQQSGESFSQYMARRRPVVEKNLKMYLGQSNPGMPPEDLDRLVQQNLAEYTQESYRTSNNQGGRVGLANGSGGITMANSLAQNIAQNRANQAARANELELARSRIPGYQAPVRAMAPTRAPMLTPRDLNPPELFQPGDPDLNIGIPERPQPGVTPPVARIQPMPIQPRPPMETDFSREINWQPGQPAPEGFKVEEMLGDEFLVPNDSQYVPPTEAESMMPPLAPIQPGSSGMGNLIGNLPGLFEKVIQPPAEELINGPLGLVPQLPQTDEEILAEREKNQPKSPGFNPIYEGRYAQDPGQRNKIPVGGYKEPLPQDQLLSGFEQFKKNNPELMRGAGTMAIVPVTLPGGYSYDFSGSQEANAFNKYLESIGQAPAQGRRQPGDIVKIGLAQPTYNDPLPQDQLMSGFAEWKRNNPDKVSNTGTAAMSYMTLPNGEPITFSGGAQASNMAQYLESIGQPPMTRTQNPIASPRKITSDGSGLAKLAVGGRVGFNGGGLTKIQINRLKNLGYSKAGTAKGIKSYGGLGVLKDILKINSFSYNKGGRVGLAEGSDDMILPMEKPETEKILTREEAEKLYPGMFVDTTTFNPVPDNAAELAIDELAKVILGTRGSDKNFMKNEYIIPTVKKISENYGYSEAEIVKMLKDQMMTYSKPKKEKMNKGGIMRLNYMIGGEAKQMEAGAPPIMYSGNMDPNAQNQQAGLPSVPGPMQMAEDGPEFDMRENGGFQPLGRQEGKDDVPAMLAKNEFVMTADAVRAAGGGSIQKGAQKMYDTMKKLESRVS